MAKLGKLEIQKLAREIIRSRPNGIQYSQLVRAVAESNPETPDNTIHGSVWNLHTLFPDQVEKPARGLFKLDLDQPNFNIRMRSQRFTPDVFYVNQFAERLKEHDADVFDALFG